jgi:hypothetical protein
LLLACPLFLVLAAHPCRAGEPVGDTAQAADRGTARSPRPDLHTAESEIERQGVTLKEALETVVELSGAEHSAVNWPVAIRRAAEVTQDRAQQARLTQAISVITGIPNNEFYSVERVVSVTPPLPRGLLDRETKHERLGPI